MAAKKKTSQTKKRPVQKPAAARAGKKPATQGKSKKSSLPAKGGKPKASAAKRSASPKAKVRAGKAAAAKGGAVKSAAKPAKVQSSKGASRKKPALAAKAAQRAAQARREAEKKDAAKQKARVQAQQAAAKAQQEREKAQREKERQRAAALKEADRLKKDREKEKERVAREKEKEAKKREQERIAREKEKERLRVLKEKEREKDRLKKEADRLKKEREKEKERLKKEKERERLEAQRKRDEEKAKREKEREAYRRAREAERERVRSEKEAARRALEGRVARQARQQARIASSARGTSARVYRPDAVPSQAGTTRDVSPAPRPVSVRSSARVPLPMRPAVPPSAGKPPPPESLDERWALIQKRLGRMPERFQREYSESFDMSWIHHDSALEGVVYTFQELKTAIDPNIVIVPDSSLQPVCEEIRRHKIAIDWVRELGNEDAPLTADTLKKLYVQLHPEEGDLKSVKYRKEIPQHRLYFHEYAPPDKIAVRIRQAFEWLHGPEPDKLKDPVRVAARLHYDLLRTFPFPNDSGKVARMLMNVLLLRAKLPPVIVHSTERQRYYDALRGSLPTIIQMINDSMRNALISIEKVLDEEEDKLAQGPTG
ncbi:MAG TPA: Fic family protein [Polyangiaceae bacterium]|nr:Fic family protein [Polyangiaceae bacterium]